MIPSQGDWQLALFSMPPNNVCDGLRHAGYQPWILQYPNWWIIRAVDIFKLMVSIKLDVPIELFKLINQASLNQTYRALVYSRSLLSTGQEELFLVVVVVVVLT